MVEDKRNDVASLYFVVTFDGLVVRADASSLSCLLYAVTAGAGHMVHEELIDANRGLSLVHLDAPMLVLLWLLLQKLIVEQYVFHSLTF